MNFRENLPRVVIQVLDDLDDYVLNDYHNNVSGITPREKVRLRWYNDNRNAILELKYRDGQLGLKKSVALNTTIEKVINSGIHSKNIADDLLQVSFPGGPELVGTGYRSKSRNWKLKVKPDFQQPHKFTCVGTLSM